MSSFSQNSFYALREVTALKALAALFGAWAAIANSEITRDSELCEWVWSPGGVLTVVQNAGHSPFFVDAASLPRLEQSYPDARDEWEAFFHRDKIFPSSSDDGFWGILSQVGRVCAFDRDGDRVLPGVRSEFVVLELGKGWSSGQTIGESVRSYVQEMCESGDTHTSSPDFLAAAKDLVSWTWCRASYAGNDGYVLDERGVKTHLRMRWRVSTGDTVVDHAGFPEGCFYLSDATPIRHPTAQQASNDVSSPKTGRVASRDELYRRGR